MPRKVYCMRCDPDRGRADPTHLTFPWKTCVLQCYLNILRRNYKKVETIQKIGCKKKKKKKKKNI